MPEYELVFIVAPTAEDEVSLQTQIDSVTGRIAQLGGEVSKVDIWGRRRMAYPIQKYQEGHYVLVNMELPSQSVALLDRDLKITESVIRHLVVCANE